MAKFLKIGIPLWLTVLVILLLTAGLLTLIIYLNAKTYNYDIKVPFIDEQKINYSLSLEYGSQLSFSNPSFFKNIRDEFIAKKLEFIEADLSTMKLKVYKNGLLVKEVIILAKGKEGAWWETPAGLYKIEAKAKNHFSSFGGVYQPYTMFFQGNFAIHGWPYYPDGQEVKSTFSGGCIRLSTENAKEIYEIVKIGTPILVFEKDFENDDFKYAIKIPEIDAKSYLVTDLQNDFIFLKKATSEILPIASITKLMTALIAVEYLNIEKEITITKEMLIKTSKPRLKIGQKISVYNLLYPLLLESSNEAAYALANQIGYNWFINLMNKKAEAIGMRNTVFFDPAGISAENVSTSEDLFNLIKYLYNNRSFILKLSAGKLNDSVYGSPIFTNLKNFNISTEDTQDINFIGGKVGMNGSTSGTIISVFDIGIKDGLKASTTDLTTINPQKRTIAIIILDSENKEENARLILDYIKSFYIKADDKQL